MTPYEALLRARKLAKSGSVEEAKNLYQQILARQPQNKKARKELKALQKSAPAGVKQQSLEQDLKSLVELFSSGATDRALAQAMHLRKIYPDQPLPLNIIGVIQNQRGNYEAAVNYCEKALEIEPSYSDALNNLGSALHNLGRHAEAERCYLRLLTVQGDDPDVLFNLANVLKESDRLPAAANCYQKSLQLRPLYEPAQLAMGHTLLKLGQYRGALTSFHKALELNPKSVDAHCGIGSVLLASNRSSEAMVWYRDALELDADNLAAKYGMAKAYRKMGKPEQAIPLLKEYQAARPDSAEVRHLLDAALGNTTEIAPSEYIEVTFNDYARDFEQQLTQVLGYQAPLQLRKILDTQVDSENLKADAIDLGCGTGLVGQAFHDCCNSIVGVDLSAKMLEKAEQKNLYTELVQGDVVTSLEKLERKFNLFLCADTLVYIGNIQPLFQAISRQADQGSILVFSTELSDKPEYTLLSSGRYAHNSAYVLEALKAANFELLAEESHPLRKENSEWLQGGFYIARYIGNAG